jgi:hypothetical protein
MATGKLYSTAFENMGGGNTAGEGPMDILSDTIKTMLTTSANTISQTADTVKADITNEVAQTGYTAGGATLGSKTYAAASLVTTFDAADITWTITGALTAAQAHTYDDTPTTPADPLICYLDFGGDETVNTADFIIQHHASGIFAVTVA